MEDSSRLSRLLRTAWKKKGLIASIGAGVLIAIFVATTIYYYVTTSPATVLVTAEDFPSGFAKFTQKDLMDHVADRLGDLVARKGGNEVARQEGFGIRPAKEPIFRAASDSASPAFQLRWKGFSLSVCRRLGMSLRAKKFLSLRVNDVSDKGWRLSAMMEEAPQYSAKNIGSAPQLGGPCSDFDSCVGDLAEQILRSVDSTSLLNFYIQQNNNDKILDLYQKVIPASSLLPSDFVRWGNAFLGSKDIKPEEKYQQAEQKYEQALKMDKNSCAAFAARGYLYDQKGKNEKDKEKSVGLFKDAEQDLRTAVKCDPRNKFTLTTLCHTLTREWTNRKDQPQLLEDAAANCQKALDIDPAFVIAATNIGYILARQRKYSDSFRHFDDLIQKYPEDSAIFVNYGFALYLKYLETKNIDLLDQAIQRTQQSLNLATNYAAANNLGFYYYERQNYTEAGNYWNKANSIYAKDADNIAGLSLWNYKLGRKQEAIALLSQAIKNPEDGKDFKEPDKLTDDPHFWSNQMISDLKKLIVLMPAN